jgi:peptide deformylase|tara:strand:+ start:209 stop:679 length:471 start_codon:yes stop_codon:yes gene_type:complete
MKLVYYPNNILSQKCNEVNVNDVDIEKLFSQMFDIMMNNNGIGLAAPQVGLDYRLFVMKDKIYVNPEIYEMSNEYELTEEGCLSFPNLWMNVKRAKEIVVGYTNAKNKKREDKLFGMNARCFQHELDHLDGVCFNQRVSRVVFEMAKKKQRKNRVR